MPRLSFSYDNFSDFDDAASSGSDGIDFPDADLQETHWKPEDAIPQEEQKLPRLLRRCSIPPQIDGHPVVLLKRSDSIDLGEEVSHDVCTDHVHIEVVTDFRKGAKFGTQTFGPSWGALLRIRRRPQQSPIFGRPCLAEAVNDIAWRQWLRNAGFFTFLRAIGVLKRGQAVPRKAEEFRTQCGVVPIKDDLFCGFWCLAHLLQCGLPELFQSLVTELCDDRLLVAKACEEKQTPSSEARLWEKVWWIASSGLHRTNIAREAGKDWDMPLLPSEEAKGRSGHAGAFVISKLQEAGLTAEVMLTAEELSKLCVRLRLDTPVITIASADAFYGDSYAHKMLVAAAQRGLQRYPELDVENDEHDDSTLEAGKTLRLEGYRLIVADVAERQGQACIPMLEQLGRPLVILLGDHFFILEEHTDAIDGLILPERLGRKRQVKTVADSGVKRSCLATVSTMSPDDSPDTDTQASFLTLDSLREQAGLGSTL